LEFAAKLAALDKLAGLVDGDDNEQDDSNGGDRNKKRKGKRTRQRDLRKAPIDEERLEITDPVLEGKAERIGAEESCELVWRRGGFVRLVIARIKYRTPITTEVSTSATSAGTVTSATSADTVTSATSADTAASATSTDTAASA